MKVLLILCSVFLSSFSCYSQLVVETDFEGNTNRLNGQYVFPATEDVSQDLFFAIGPNGIPQYGKEVSWNLEAGANNDIARFFHVIKGDWDRSAVRAHEEIVEMNFTDESFPPEDTPNVVMDNNWIKLGNSWNFSHDNYAIAIISFTNQGEKDIEKGHIRFSHPLLDFLNVHDIFMYNDWTHLVNTFEIPGRKVYEFMYENLSPHEVRYLYFKIDLSQKTSRVLPSILLRAEMVGHQVAQLNAEGIIPPHDPNALSLLNIYENTDIVTNCDFYSEYPELEDACLDGLPFWVTCDEDTDRKCDMEYSLNYPFCNIDSEVLKYQITCLNDGKGVARDVEMFNLFEPVPPPFDESTFMYSGSHTVSGQYDSSQAFFDFDEINLPGLNSAEAVYTYDECSAHVIFSMQTLCNVSNSIKAQAGITFYDLNEESVGLIKTNTVITVPEQGIYVNYEPECIGCGFGGHSKSMSSAISDTRIFTNNAVLEISFESESKTHQTNLKIFDMSGRIVQSRVFQPNGSTLINEQVNISSLSSGIYIVSVQNGSKKFIEKIIHH